MKKGQLLLLLALITCLLSVPSTVSSMDLIFNHQGMITDADGNPVADGDYNMIFSLWDDLAAGTELWAETLTVPVNNGLYDVVLGQIVPPDPVIFDNQLYLQIQIGSDGPLTPRTIMTSAPYAAKAMSVPGFTPGQNNTVTGAHAFVAGDGNSVLSDFGSITGGQMNLVEDLNYASPDFDTTGIFDGKSPVYGSDNYDKSLVCPSGAGWIGGGFSNVATGSYAAVGAGSDNQALGAFSSILGGCQNRARDRFDVVTGGYNNQTVLNGGFRTISGGYNNNINSFWMSTIGGGYSNTIDPPSVGGTVGGGFANRILGHVGTIAGGYVNNVFDFGGTVGGGQQNFAAARYSTVSGGQENTANLSYATVGGGYGNNASGEMATIGGGGRSDLADPLSNNEVYDNYGTVGGGGRNKAGSNDGIEINDQYTTIGGGYFNQTLSGYSTIGGGSTNTTSGVNATIGGGIDNFTSNWAATIGGGQSNEALGYVSTVGGGRGNLLVADSAVISGGTANTSNGESSVIGGGWLNNIDAASTYATISGGSGNIIQGYGGTIGGGDRNTISAGGNNGTVGGGSGNTASYMATVPGGADNVAMGEYSLAAGRTANATHACSFVWSDCCVDAIGTALPLYSTGANTFNARATGGFYLFSDCDTLWDPTTPPSGVYLPPGGSMWLSGSDRNLKKNIREVNNLDILNKVSTLPIYKWSYKTQDESIEHIGPMAQDFYNTFNVGDNNTSIAALDPAGVALAAIKQLHKENAELRSEIENLKNELKDNKAVSAKLAQLTELVNSLLAEKENSGQDNFAVNK